MLKKPILSDHIRVSRLLAILIKEFIQLSRDKVTLFTMISIPIMQLILFGYAINTNPRHLPSAILLQENTDVSRSILMALRNTAYFDIVLAVESERDLDDAMRSGKVLFAIEVPAGFERKVRRGENPSILVVADASDPVAASNAINALDGVINTALERDRVGDTAISYQPPFNIIVHRKYNPTGASHLNIVPGMLGAILTMTLLILTALSGTRELERGTIEGLLSLPVFPVEIIAGKIIPYLVLGSGQGIIIIIASVVIFEVPIYGSVPLLTALTFLFIAVNLSIGYTFSTVARNQLQAVQLSIMFFLPSILLSGFVFPFAGMPLWARYLGETLPLTHFVRIARGIMLKGATLGDIGNEVLWLFAMLVATIIISVKRFRNTLE